MKKLRTAGLEQNKVINEHNCYLQMQHVQNTRERKEAFIPKDTICAANERKLAVNYICASTENEISRSQ